MGHWVEICILSKLPIEENEYCVMFIGNNLLNNLFDIDKLKHVFYSDMQIYAGNYNGRGTLYNKQEYEESIFVNWDVWNWLILIYDKLELARTKQSYYEEAESIIERSASFLHRTVQIRQYMKISYSASLLRLVPNSIRLKGSTEVRLEEFREWLNLLTELNNNKINIKVNK